MINLLPPQEKQRLAQEGTRRMIIIWGFMVAVFLTSFAMTLLFTAIQIKGRADVQELLLEGLRKELRDPSIAKLKQELAEANNLLSVIEPFLLDDKEVSKIFGLVAEHLPQSVNIVKLSYKDSPGTLTLEGFSPTRQDLLALKDNLEGESFFSKVEFPSGNWIKPADINFIVNLTINP